MRRRNPPYCDDFVPKQMRPYQVPIAFRADVNGQIRELLDIGLIRPSVSPMASPIVCVAKKSGGVRIAGDCRHANNFSVGDAHPTSKVKKTERDRIAIVCLAVDNLDVYHVVTQRLLS